MIRKRIQECVQRRDWEGAIKEYRSLAELDQSNPNVFNELGDLYLKANNKLDGLSCFEKAIEAYARVGLFNNAVAVCKKLLRLQPGKHDFLITLGNLRKRQGLLKEAGTYYLSYLEKIMLDTALDPDEQREKAVGIANEMSESADILNRIADYLLKWEFKEDAATVLSKLQRLYASRGMTQKSEEVQERIESLGFPSDTAPGSGEAPAEQRIEGTEDGQKSFPAASSEFTTDRAPSPHPSQPQTEPMVRQSATSASQHGEYRTVHLERKTSEPAAGPTTQTLTTEPIHEEPEPAEKAQERPPEEPAEKPREAVTQGKTLSEGEVWVPKEELPDKFPASSPDKEGEVVHVSQIVDEFQSEVRGSVEEEDYRSHYDLGMAYLEMNLLPEAIREFQFAAKSSVYQVRSLEMIGLCFLKQDQPRLAIKQLTRGLDLIRGSDRENLGLLYNLGLAYEMVGDAEKAKNCFEDVYVVDVSFREVAEKIKKYSG